MMDQAWCVVYLSIKLLEGKYQFTMHALWLDLIICLRAKWILNTCKDVSHKLTVISKHNALQIDTDPHLQSLFQNLMAHSYQMKRSTLHGNVDFSERLSLDFLKDIISILSRHLPHFLKCVENKGEFMSCFLIPLLLVWEQWLQSGLIIYCTTDSVHMLDSFPIIHLLLGRAIQWSMFF